MESGERPKLPLQPICSAVHSLNFAPFVRPVLFHILHFTSTHYRGLKCVLLSIPLGFDSSSLRTPQRDSLECSQNWLGILGSHGDLSGILFVPPLELSDTSVVPSPSLVYTSSTTGKSRQSNFDFNSQFGAICPFVSAGESGKWI